MDNGPRLATVSVSIKPPDTLSAESLAGDTGYTRETTKL